MNGRIFEYERTLLAIAERRLVPRGTLRSRRQRDRALEMLREGYHALSQRRRHTLRSAPSMRPGRPPPPRVLELLRLVLGTVGLHHWAERHESGGLKRLGNAGTVAAWLTRPPIAPSEEVLGAGLRYGLGIATEKDRKLIDARLGQQLRRHSMPPQQPYEFDPRGLPPVAPDQKQERDEQVKEFTELVVKEVKDTAPNAPQALQSFVLGAMSLDGFLELPDPNDPNGPSLTPNQLAHIRDLRFESEKTTDFLGSGPTKNRDAYQKINDSLLNVRKVMNGAAHGYFEELAFVSRELIRNAADVPIDASGLGQRITVALAGYQAPDAAGALALPSLSDPQVVDADLVQDNIRAVGLIYAGWNLEEARLFQVLDRVVEVFMNGQLPVGYDNGGRALSDYYFDDSDQRLTEAARRMTYSRVLGVPGGEISREAPPNRTFQDLLLRFMASVSEFERQRRIDDVFGAPRSRIDILSNTGEQVRKTGFDLAANASLYGYGGTFFVAKRLAKQIERALRILSTQEILSAYGVQSPFQVIERVCASDLGGTVPNVVQRKTMAESGKTMLDIVAHYTSAWRGTTGQPLFVDPIAVAAAGGGNIGLRGLGGIPTPDIPFADQDRLARAVEQWMAVNGITDEQRVRLGEPQTTAPAPSIPTVSHDGGGGAAFDQIKQMISAGQTPSLDQLKALMPDGAGMGGMVRQ